MEKSVENLTQHMAKVLQTMEDTQKTMKSLLNSKPAESKDTEGEGSSSVTDPRAVSNIPHIGQRPGEGGKWPEGSANTGGEGFRASTDQGKEEGIWWQVRKLEMPLFSGKNPEGWLFHAERYFEVNGLSKRAKIGAIGVSLDGDTLAWFQWMEARTPFRNWEQL